MKNSPFSSSKHHSEILPQKISKAYKAGKYTKKKCNVFSVFLWEIDKGMGSLFFPCKKEKKTCARQITLTQFLAFIHFLKATRGRH